MVLKAEAEKSYFQNMQNLLIHCTATISCRMEIFCLFSRIQEFVLKDDVQNKINQENWEPIVVKLVWFYNRTK